MREGTQCLLICPFLLFRYAFPFNIDTTNVLGLKRQRTHARQGASFSLRPCNGKGWTLPPTATYATKGETASAIASKPTKRRPAHSNQQRLRWTIESIEKIGGSVDVLVALNDLYNSQTKDERRSAEKLLWSLDLSLEYRSVRERVVKVCADAGLVTFALSVLQSMVNKTDINGEGEYYLPSTAACSAVLNRLRKQGKVTQMRELLDQIAEFGAIVASKRNYVNGLSTPSSEEGVDIVLFNSYLAALCDNVMSSYDKKQMFRGRKRPGDRRRASTSDSFLQEALSLVVDPSSTRRKFFLSKDLDIFSFNTMLSAAARAGNHTCVNAVYSVLKEQQAYDLTLEKDIFTYNALLRSAANKGERSNNNNQENFSADIVANDDRKMPDALQLLDEINSNPLLIPDQYTVDLALLPLVREGRVGEVLSIVREYRRSCGNQERDRTRMSKAFQSFMITLVKGGEIAMSRLILDSFLLENKDAKSNQEPLPLTAKHFNILIEGYRKVYENANFQINQATNSTSPSYVVEVKKAASAHDEANHLFELMIDLQVSPDGYTLTSMMAIQKSSSDITTLLKRLVLHCGVQLSLPAYHSIMMAYGRANDPSMSCYIFDAMVSRTENESTIQRTLNTWNTLHAVFAEESNCEKILEVKEDSTCSGVLKSILCSETDSASLTPFWISDQVNGMTCAKASRKLLSIMKQCSEENSVRREEECDDFIFPFPNSQTYCYVATALSHSKTACGNEAMSLFNEAVNEYSVPADGRFVNAVLRCFGSDIDGALFHWKSEIGSAVRKCNDERKRNGNQDLIASYHGLFTVCGRAGRPDIALRLVYAMKSSKMNLDVDETALRCYEAGKKRRNTEIDSKAGDRVMSTLSNAFVKQCESILFVECTKYDKTDKSRQGDRRVKIIF